MSNRLQGHRRASRLIAALALFIPSFAFGAAKDAAVEKPAAPEAPAVPRARPFPHRIFPAGSLLRDVAQTLGRGGQNEASPFEPPGRPPDRPPVDPPGHNDPPNPPGQPPDRPPFDPPGQGDPPPND